MKTTTEEPTPHKPKTEQVYVTVGAKTKYSTIARRAPPLATAANVKITNNGRIFLPGDATFIPIYGYNAAAVSALTLVVKR